MRKYLKILREKHNLTQQNVADKLNVTRQYYNLIEKGERKQNIDLSLIVELSKIFNVPIDEIIREENKLLS